MQLAIYGLAATNKGLYHKKIDEANLTFYYLQDQSKITMKKTASEIAAVKKEIKQIVDDIRKSDFFPRVGPWCDFCSFRMICEAWQ